MFTTSLGIFGYHSQREVMFLKITVSVPRLLSVVKRVLEQGFQCPGYNSHAYQCYETNIDFDTRLVTGDEWNVSLKLLVINFLDGICQCYCGVCYNVAANVTAGSVESSLCL
jgi:hypothetical protein